MNREIFEERLKQQKDRFSPLIRYGKDDRFLELNFTESNTELSAQILENTGAFTDWVNSKMKAHGAQWGIGGYDEHRTIYSRSAVFDAGEEPRRLHLGLDIWGPAGTSVYAPVEGVVHSFAFNDAYGDYGATLILQHELDGIIFHTLYGHLSLHSIQDKKEGEEIGRGDWIAAFGEPLENGQWPPHLHFQVIIDMEGKKGDYPGVCKYSERNRYLSNCPDPALFFSPQKH